MTQKKMKSVRGTLASREAPKMTPKAMKKKKSKANTKKANLLNQISDCKKFKLSKCKGKSVVEPTQMDIVADSQGILSKEDLMMEILSWLPVRSLFRFKCVSKSWDNITFDPYFKKKHQRHHANSVRFLLLHYDSNQTPFYHNFYSTSSLSSAEDVQILDKLASNNAAAFHVLFGSCDGLVLIGVASHVKDQLVLWNPSTRESILLPLPEFGIINSTFGLGYDATTDDYKILAIHDKMQTTVKPYCGILALKSGSWRNVGINNFYPVRDSLSRMDPLAFVHGAFHWILSGCGAFVASLSISNEVRRNLPLLDQMHHYIPFSTEYGLSVLEGMLCFFTTCMVRGEGTFLLWAMKDYAVNGCWTQLFKIKVAGLSVAKPIYRFADGDVLLHCRIKEFDSFRTSKGPFALWSNSLMARLSLVEIITFKESLISPKSLI